MKKENMMLTENGSLSFLGVEYASEMTQVPTGTYVEVEEEEKDKEKEKK